MIILKTSEKVTHNNKQVIQHDRSFLIIIFFLLLAKRKNGVYQKIWKEAKVLGVDRTVKQISDRHKVLHNKFKYDIIFLLNYSIEQLN